ncbi:AAA-like domain-containing protein [Anabaena sp. UHCC 0451]|uniref:AAA-like domain-containing protein n=1 Tax=Anabaena sp. UHCC 0451 TaxID=2055235 RepID=UPI002B2214D6|nr:AAA-like domain-containing protein [Anabaena sp. UHCC 0451]MEA5578855.1 AAA-like domain-containing protein [Anabaena sp. UHCC 0451]
MNSPVPENYQYQFGGSLSPNAPTYVTRKADDDLYQAVKAGEFCFVLNSRQMGKSSLRVKTMQKLQAENIACVAIDLTAIGTSGLTSEQWYNGIINNITESLKLADKFDLDALWEENKRLSPVQIFGKFIDKVLKIISTQIVIFIDEIDSILSLDFPVDDFFALIRAFFNLRVDNPEYNRITFVLLGVATPSELIQDKKRTPFNIGKGIELTGFEFTEALPLIRGFSHLTSNPETVLKEILAWTGGQPFLTQKICNFIRESQDIIPDGEEASFVENLVRERMIENWESQDEPEHFKTIRDRILKRDEQKTAYLLDLYQQIWHSGEIDADNSIEQSDLQLAGIVVKKDSKLKVYNRIYSTIFDNLWIEKKLAGLRPYADSFRQWLLSGKNDKSRLLRGEALAEAEGWVKDKKLGFEDQEFVSESRNQEKKEEAIKIEAEAKQEAEKQLRIAKEKVTEIERNISKIRDLSAVASQLQQNNQVNEANQFLNIAGLVLQEKIENHALKEALLDSSLVLGYEYLKIEKKYIKAKEEFDKSFKKIPKENKNSNNNASYLAVLVYIYYVKGKLEKESNKALDNYKIAFEKFNILQSCFQSNLELFTLDLNILYNGNIDIVALLYHQLNGLDSSNTAYNESFKVYLLNELDYLMQNNRWKDADEKNWQFLLVSAKREKQGYLELNDIKNFKYNDLKQLDSLWVENSQEHFGYSIQKRIYLETGNYLNFDDWYQGELNWERIRIEGEEWVNFTDTVGWTEKTYYRKYEELGWEDMKNLDTYKLYGTIPYWHGGGGFEKKSLFTDFLIVFFHHIFSLLTETVVT